MWLISVLGNTAVSLAALFLIGRALQDSFKVVLLPRSSPRRSKFVGLFFRLTWTAWSRLGRMIGNEHTRDGFLAVYGPLSMALLFTSWIVLLVFGFGLLHWVVGSQDSFAPEGLLAAILLSADMFFTVGSVASEMHQPVTHALGVVEAGLGFGFIALTIGYLPVLYGHFSSREAHIVRFQVRAAPGWTTQDILLFYKDADPATLARWLRDCEIWIADLMVSHNSYPMLAFYRSQRENPSWLAVLATTLDVCSLLRPLNLTSLGVQPAATYAAGIAFLVDLNASLDLAGASDGFRDRLSRKAVPTPTDAFGDLGRQMSAATTSEAEKFRAVYEPELSRLSAYLMLPLPPIAVGDDPDRKQTPS